MSSNPISIITDSTCDIPQNLIEQYSIEVIPQIIIWNGQQYRDRVDLQPQEFYTRLQQEPSRPTSSLAGVEGFSEAYEKAARKGAKEIIMLTVSSAMSGTYQMALNAAKGVSIPVHVVDSKGPTMTLGWQVLAAARAVQEGLGIDQILEKVSSVRERLVQLVAMDTLEYLKQGGRIGGAVKWVGGLLSVKPLVGINHRSGLVEPVSLARSHKPLVEMLYKKFFERLTSEINLHIAVLHGNVLEEAEALAERIRTEFKPVELIINITGPVLGMNTGPGALALCGYAEG